MSRLVATRDKGLDWVASVATPRDTCTCNGFELERARFS